MWYRSLVRLFVVLLVAALPGCAVNVGDHVEALTCGQRDVATYKAPAGDGFTCWAPNAPGHCVMTAADVTACDVPRDDDAIIQPGATVHMWCGLLEPSESEDRYLAPVFCADGQRMFDANGVATR